MRKIGAPNWFCFCFSKKLLIGTHHYCFVFVLVKRIGNKKPHENKTSFVFVFVEQLGTALQAGNNTVKLLSFFRLLQPLPQHHYTKNTNCNTNSKTPNSSISLSDTKASSFDDESTTISINYCSIIDRPFHQHHFDRSFCQHHFDCPFRQFRFHRFLLSMLVLLTLISSSSRMLHRNRIQQVVRTPPFFIFFNSNQHFRDQSLMTINSHIIHSKSVIIV